MPFYTPVILRRWRTDGREVFALFPTLPGTHEPHTCASYQRIGQHASADYTGCIAASVPADHATETDASDLLAELRRIGYADLQVIARAHPAHYAARVADILAQRGIPA